MLFSPPGKATVGSYPWVVRLFFAAFAGLLFCPGAEVYRPMYYPISLSFSDVYSSFYVYVVPGTVRLVPAVFRGVAVIVVCVSFVYTYPCTSNVRHAVPARAVVVMPAVSS